MCSTTGLHGAGFLFYTLILCFGQYIVDYYRISIKESHKLWQVTHCSIVCNHFVIHCHKDISSFQHTAAAEQRKDFCNKDPCLFCWQLKVIPHVFTFNWLPFDSQLTETIVCVAFLNISQEMFYYCYLKSCYLS